MARPNRAWISRLMGSYHIMSKVAGGELLFSNADKEYFLELIERFAGGFFVEVHAFCIMSNHFHILLSGLDEEAGQASKEELFKRYEGLYPKNPIPPEGTFNSCNQFIPDEDGGVERLRNRLGSVSRFVQELKQTFSRWYNKKYGRTGYLWGGRYKGVITSMGEAQLICSTYIDLNPIRAKIVSKPEEYQWSSLGMRVNSRKRARQFLSPITVFPLGGYTLKDEYGEVIKREEWFGPMVIPQNSYDHLPIYREFVYASGKIEKNKPSFIPAEIVDEFEAYHAAFGLRDRLRYRMKNISQGLAFGDYALIAHLQKQWHRKHIRPRSFMGRDENCNWSFSTRVLK